MIQKINQNAMNREGNTTIQNIWIKSQLENGVPPWKFLVGHDCTYGYDNRGNLTSESRDLKAILQSSSKKPQIYFCGQFNTLQLFKENEKTIYANSGSAAFVKPQIKAHSLQNYYLEESGFLYVRVFPSKTYLNYIIGIPDNTWKNQYRQEVN